MGTLYSRSGGRFESSLPLLPLKIKYLSNYRRGFQTFEKSVGYSSQHRRGIAFLRQEIDDRTTKGAFYSFLGHIS